MKFKDALNPTEDELCQWAQDPDAEYPDEMSQDWDLILASRDLAPALIRREFFLGCLYTLSGDAVRGGSDDAWLNPIRALFDLVPEDAPTDLKQWVNRSKHLFLHPETYNYPDWGYGDLAYNDRET